MENKIAVVRVRGNIGVRKKIRDTLRFLKLYKKNTCIIIPSKESYLGMLKLVKDYVTWGEMDLDTFKLLLEKRGKISSNQKLDSNFIKEKTNLTIEEFSKEYFEGKKTIKDIPGLKKFFRLSPPKKGFEKKGIKTPFSMGGALGYRKEKINDLIKRMI